MAEYSRIAWTHHTANFWMGCDKVSPGCAHCYAETLTGGKMQLTNVWGADANRQAVKSIAPNLRKWHRDAVRDNARRRVFVMSLGDFFEDHPQANEQRPAAWDLMRQFPLFDYQILTKRHENIERNLPSDWPWPNAWLGVSVENQRMADERIPALLKIPAAVHFLSVEPLLAQVNLEFYLGPLPEDEDGAPYPGHLDWIIVGGESGPGWRPMDHAWARLIRDQCVEANTAFFMKQSAAPRTEMGTWLEEENGSRWQWYQYPGEMTKPKQIRASLF